VTDQQLAETRGTAGRLLDRRLSERPAGLDKADRNIADQIRFAIRHRHWST
jgi:hypothetical protein